MPYSLVSAATLGFDLVRLPAGGQVADVLLTGLGADADTLGRLAAAHPAAGRPDAERAAQAIRARRAHELAATGVPQLRDVPAAVSGVDVRTSRLVALLEQGTIGNTPALERLVRDDVLGGEHTVAAAADPEVVARAADVLADAATGWWAADALDPAARRELTAPFAAATALVTPPRPDLGPAAAGIDELLGGVRELDDAGRRRWRIAVDAVRAQRRPWAAAMHGASWAAHVSGRTRTLAATQLLAVQAFTDGGFTARDGAEGVWNALAGCVQGLAMTDLLDDESRAVLGEPWVLVTGRHLPLVG
ncbi:hypothetical protein GCM10027300_25150 [Modestobacter lapidis]